MIATARGTGNSEAWYLYNKDTRGSTSSLIDDGGTVATAYEYDEFGNTMVRAGEDFDNELCYTGQVYDQSTGLYYYNARFYNPEDGRFVTQDTYRGENTKPDTLHLYAYCANNPVNYVDPSGHEKVNVNKSKVYWWGVLNKFSYKRAKKLRKELNNYKNATDVISLITNPFGLANIYIGAFSFGNVLLSKYVSYFQKRIKECNKKGKGIKYKVRWWMTFKMRTQGKKW